MSKKLQTWLTFAVRVRNHIRDYVIAQYGEDGNDPATEYTAEDCIRHAQRYLARFGRQSRHGEELRDLYKAAHYIQMAHDRISGLSSGVSPEYETFADAESFANAPISVTEHRGNKTENGAKWTQRDALIAMLREIDKGNLPNLDALVIAYRTNDGESTQSFFYQACPDHHTALGVLEAAKFKLQSS
jgi:hypothetical protein